MVVLVENGIDPNYLKKRFRGNFSFICFIDNYLERKRWEDALSPTFKKVYYKPLLEKYRKELRDSFLDFINSMGKDAGELWPLTTIAEENTFVSNFFIDCIRLKVIEEITKKDKQEFIIIVDEPYFFDTVAQILQEKGQTLHKKRITKHYLKKLRINLFPFLQMAKFVIISFSHWYAVRGFKKQLPNDKKGSDVILHTWIDDGSFTEEGRYRDRYFGGLIEWLIKKGYHIYIVPHIYNTRHPLKEVYKLFISSGYNFIIPYQYYSFLDYLRAVARGIKILSLCQRRIYFLNLNVKYLIKRDSYRQTLGLIHFFMYIDFFRILKSYGFNFDAAIDVFEGMIPERTWIMGFLKAYPKGITIGYQHTLFSRDLLSYFVYRGDSLRSVLPHRIVCTGDMIKNLLINEGLPKERLLTGCAFRYAYLWKKRETFSSSQTVTDNKESKILIALPLQLSGAAELLSIMSNIVSRRTDIEFYIKPHPMMNKLTLQKIVKASNWPEAKTYIAEGSIEEWVEKVDLIISTASATVVDALVAGKPVIIVGREGVLDLNPLDWIESSFTSTYLSEKEIEERIDTLLYLNEKETEEIFSFGQKILMGCFNPVTEENLSAFSIS